MSPALRTVKPPVSVGVYKSKWSRRGYFASRKYSTEWGRLFFTVKRAQTAEVVKPKLGVSAVEGINRDSVCPETMSVIVKFLLGSLSSSRCFPREYEPCSGAITTGVGMARTAVGVSRRKKSTKPWRQGLFVNLASKRTQRVHDNMIIGLVFLWSKRENKEYIQYKHEK